MAKKPTFLIFCHRFFEVRFMIVSGLLDELSKKGKVVWMLPENLATGMKPFLPEDSHIEIAQYKSNLGKVQNLLLNFLGDVLYLTFPNTKELPNATAEFHRQYYTTRNVFWKNVVVGLSRLASHYKFIRGTLIALYQSVLPKNTHDTLLEKIKPDVMLGCSFGMGTLDASFIAEAKAHNIPAVTIVQSWDRTSNKGYPTIHPDHALVWNEIMKRECEVHLDFKSDQVHVTGSPLWDEHFNKSSQPIDKNWRKKLGIPASRKVIFFSCGGFGSHPANMEVIPQIFRLAKEQPFKDKVHIVFRMYPQYLSPVTQKGEGKKKKDEIEALLAQYKNVKDISILYPEVQFDGKNFFPTAEDHVFMTECLRQCDVSLSQVSSQMIEACIFEKPAINVEFGRRVTDKYDLEICDYKTEHLLRLYRTDAIYRVQKPDQLEETIRSALESPTEKQPQREALVQQEAPAHRGTASQESARIIAEIAKA